MDAIFSCALLVLSALLFLIYQIVMKKLKLHAQESKSHVPPGSRGLPFIGETLQFMAALKSDRGIYDFIRIRRSRYGNCFVTNVFGRTEVFFSSTESAKAILNSEPGKFTKRYIKSVAELVGKQSILCASSQQHHKLIRGRLSNSFTSRSLSLFVQQFDRLAVENLRSWERRDTVVVLEEALKMTGKAMCKMLMSIESGYKLEVLQKEVACVCKALLAFPIKIPGTRFYKGLQARKKIMGIIEKEISERRRGLVGQHEDLLESLLDLEDKKCYDSANNRQTLLDEEIKDNILTMIIAGQDTTASAITWMVKYLDENQDVLHKLSNEQIQLARKSPRNTVLTLEDLNDMPYASKVVKESLRMASIVAWFPRLALNDCEIEGYGIKKGWSVNIDAKQVHLDPTVYNDPNEFNPSRFEDESKPYSFLAFGVGARTCLGIHMAKAMMLVFLHRLITTYSWKVMDPDSSIEKWAMFSRLKSGCPMNVKRITNEADGY